MSRHKRFGLTGVAHHVVQLGYNHQPAFFCAEDYRCYKACLGAAAEDQPCHVHAYALLPNQVHLLVTPYQPNAIARLMQSIGRTYVQQVNKRLNRIGTLWAGRYKASLVEPGPWLLRAQHYIEQLPVHHGLTQSADAYPWSSYHAHSCGRPDAMIVDHASFIELGANDQLRAQAFSALYGQLLGAAQLRAIERAHESCSIVGEAEFVQLISGLITHRVLPGQRGRPVKNKGHGLPSLRACEA